MGVGVGVGEGANSSLLGEKQAHTIGIPTGNTSVIRSMQSIKDGRLECLSVFSSVL